MADTKPRTDTIAPTALNFNPADEATGVPVSSNIVITFSEEILLGAGTIVLKNASGTVIDTFSSANSDNVSISGDVLTINPSLDLGSNTGYSVEFAPDSVKDLAGNSYAGTTSYNFTTASSGSGTPTVNPTLASFVAEFDNKTASMVGDVELNGALYVLSTKPLSTTNYRTDPDGTKSYLTSVTVTKIGNGQILAQNEIAQIYAGGLDATANNNNALARGTIGAVNGNIKVFFSEKDSGASYGQNGYAYSIDAQSLTSSKSTVFSNANWGWYPRIDSSGDITHFSFAGYYIYKNTTLQYALQPSDAVLPAENQKLVTAGMSGNLTTSISADALSSLLVGDLKLFVGYNSATKVGTAGNDVLTGTSGNDAFDGGAGTDTAIFTGTRADHTLAKTATGWTINSSADGTDTLQNVERLQFSNETLALDIAGNAGQAYRIYQAAFNRTPDNGGLKYWVGRMDAGTTQDRVAAEFIGSPEFKLLYGSNPTNADFLTKLYSNVLHRTPDPGGYDWWLGELNAGRYNKTTALASFAESPENQAGVIGVIQNGIDLFN